MFKVLDGFYQNAIDEHLDPERKKLTDEQDIIDALLQLKNDRSFSMDLTPAHIKPLMMVWLFYIFLFDFYHSFLAIAMTLYIYIYISA